MFFGSYAVTLEGRDVENIVVPLVEGAVVEGTVRWEGRPSHAARTSPRVRAPLADGTSFGDSLTGQVAANGSFRIRGIMPGAHFFQLDGLPAPWGMKAASLRGRDVSASAVEANAGERITGLVLTVSDTLPGVHGIVRDAAGAPSPGALVVAAPAGGGAAVRGSPRFRTTVTGQDGRYALAALMPGEYRIAALTGISDAGGLGAEAVALVEAGGTALTTPGVERLDLTAVAAAGR
jgi:hypothetical protein